MFKNKFVLVCLFLLSTFQVMSSYALAMEVNQVEKQRQNALSMNVTKTLVDNIDAERTLTIGELKREINIELDKVNVLNERLSDSAFLSINGNLRMNKDEVLNRIKRLKSLIKERLEDGDVEVEDLESSINAVNLKKSGEKKCVRIISDKV